jgi:saccharopine dehydrogenase-like NADP-dependent oxidoreductase
MKAPRILIVGGYGVVGEQIAEIMVSRNPAAELWIGGRSLQSAVDCAARHVGTRGVRIDITDNDPLANLPELPDVVVAVANDRDDNLLLASARRGIAYVDITRWTPRMLKALERLSGIPTIAPVILASGWMAGVAATVAAHHAAEFDKIRSIDIDILYAIKDKAGPNSVEYADQLNVPFTIWSDGKPQTVKPLTDPHKARFSDGRMLDCYRFDTPDQYTLVKTLGAAGVSSRLAYDDAAAAKFMRLLSSSGIWALLSLRPFKRLRRAIIYNPGEGAQHEFVVRIAGIDAAGAPLEKHISVIDPQGQTHITAAGAVAQVERILGLRGRAMLSPGISFPDQAADCAAGLAALREMGVSVAIEP